MTRRFALFRLGTLGLLLALGGIGTADALPKQGSGVTPPDWADAATGTYMGQLSNGKIYSTVVTVFTIDPSGRMRGTYRVQDPTGILDGRLELARITGENGAVFQWNDRTGSGTLTVLFATNAGHFDGKWTSTNVAASKGQTWNGKRISRP